MKRKICSEGFGLIMIILLGSILIQQFAYQAPFQQYGVEFVCFFGGCYYLIIRSIFLGNNVYEVPNTKIRKFFIINSITSSSVITIISVVSRMKNDTVDFEFIGLSVFLFIVAFCVTYFVQLLIHRINRNRQNKLINEMNKSN